MNCVWASPRNQTFITVQDSGFNAAKNLCRFEWKPAPGVVDGSKNLLDSGCQPSNISVAATRRLEHQATCRKAALQHVRDLRQRVIDRAVGASKHSWRWGYHVRREDARRFLDGSARGNSVSSRRDFAAAMSICDAVFAQHFVTGSGIRGMPTGRIPIKVKDNFTLNYGVRYEYPSAIHQVRTRQPTLSPAWDRCCWERTKFLPLIPPRKDPPRSSYAGSLHLSDSGVKSDKNNFVPVLGFAYTPPVCQMASRKRRPVIRGGFRVGYDEIFNNIPANMGWNALST